MNHSFSIKIAKLYGVDEAIIIENLAFWITKNKANNKNYNDGFYWTYNSETAFTKLFPYWSRRQIQRILKSLEDKKIIKVGNYNKAKFDKTKWYTIINTTVLDIYEISYKSQKSTNDPNGSIDITKSFNGMTENVQPIPDINTNINTNINNNNKEPKNNVVVDEKYINFFMKEFKKRYGHNFNKERLIELYKSKGPEILEKYLKDYQKVIDSKEIIKSIPGLFYSFVKYSWTVSEVLKNLKNNKPVQALNYEQREYDDKFFDNLYDNI